MPAIGMFIRRRYGCDGRIGNAVAGVNLRDLLLPIDDDDRTLVCGMRQKVYDCFVILVQMNLRLVSLVLGGASLEVDVK